MKRLLLGCVASVLALVGLLVAPSLAQQTSPSPSYPNWTGAQYPFSQHLSVMLLHFDDVALALARAAKNDATSASIKALATNVINARTREIETVRAIYTKTYGRTPPALPSPQAGYGPGMMYGSSYGHGDGNGNGNGNGMMGGPGMMYGSQASGSGANEQPLYGPMMGYGDGYQIMMGGRANWWRGTSSVNEQFVPALMRLDAMELSMATLGLTATDASTKDLARNVVSGRTAELARLAQTIR